MMKSFIILMGFIYIECCELYVHSLTSILIIGITE